MEKHRKKREKRKIELDLIEVIPPRDRQDSSMSKLKESMLLRDRQDSIISKSKESFATVQSRRSH